MANTTLTLEGYTSIESQHETALYLLEQANQSISDLMARQRMREGKE